MRSVLILALLAALVVLACNEAPRTYRPCPPGVDPSSFDCVRVDPSDGSGDGGDRDGGTTPDGSPIADTGVTPDTGEGPDGGVIPDGCIPICGDAECGPDGCGGACGTCAIDEQCSDRGRCVQGQAGTDSCRGIVECVQRCRTEQCWMDCIADGTPDAQDLFGAAVECIDVNCGHLVDDEQAYGQCQEEMCGDLLLECWGGDVPGEVSCSMIIDCIVACDTDACQEECFFAGTREARREFQDLVACVDRDRGCEDVGSVEEWVECVHGICPTEAGACFDSDVPIPTLGCSDRDFQRLEGMGAELPSLLVECGWSCTTAGGEVRVDCAGLCVASAAGLTSSCGACSGTLSACMVQRCGDTCDDPMSTACEDCTADNCEDDFLLCAVGAG